MNANWEVTYMDRNGAGCVAHFADEITLEQFVANLRREATIRRDGNVIGYVYKTTGEVDDRRVKWLWSFEKAGRS